MNRQVLERYRQEKGLSITELSRLVNRTPGWYSRIKDGKSQLPVRYIEPLADIFGIRADQLAKELFSDS